jgi:hypothetical protein
MLILMSLLGTSTGAQNRQADGTLTLSQGHVTVGVGYSWAQGTLTYRGKTFPVKVTGLSVREVGVLRADAAGPVYNMATLEDFNGLYSTAVLGESVGRRGVAELKNQNGVLIVMTSLTQGISLRLAADGIKLSIGE